MGLKIASKLFLRPFNLSFDAISQVFVTGKHTQKIHTHTSKQLQNFKTRLKKITGTSVQYILT